MSEFSECYEFDQLSVMLKLLEYVYVTETEVTFPERSGKRWQRKQNTDEETKL